MRLTRREVDVLELKCAGVRSGSIATQLGIPRQSVSRTVRTAQTKLFEIYKEAIMEEPTQETTSLTKYESRAAIEKSKPDDDASVEDWMEWKLRVIALDYPETAKLLVMVLASASLPMSQAVNELYDQIPAFDPRRSEIDARFGPGIGDMMEQESRASDNMFSDAGIEAGGIFGTGAVDIPFHSPSANQREARVERDRAIARSANANAELAEAQIRNLEEARRTRELADGGILGGELPAHPDEDDDAG